MFLVLFLFNLFFVFLLHSSDRTIDLITSNEYVQRIESITYENKKYIIHLSQDQDNQTKQKEYAFAPDHCLTYLFVNNPLAEKSYKIHELEYSLKSNVDKTYEYYNPFIWPVKLMNILIKNHHKKTTVADFLGPTITDNIRQAITSSLNNAENVSPRKIIKQYLFWYRKIFWMGTCAVGLIFLLMESGYTDTQSSLFFFIAAMSINSALFYKPKTFAKKINFDPVQYTGTVFEDATVLDSEQQYDLLSTALYNKYSIKPLLSIDNQLLNNQGNIIAEADLKESNEIKIEDIYGKNSKNEILIFKQDGPQPLSKDKKYHIILQNTQDNELKIFLGLLDYADGHELKTLSRLHELGYPLWNYTLEFNTEDDQEHENSKASDQTAYINDHNVDVTE